MNTILISSLLGVFVKQVVTLEDSWTAIVTVFPPGSTIYLGESVFLRCTVQSNSTLAWSYLWRRDKGHAPPTPNVRHLVSGDSYSITAVTGGDAGTYWCKAERGERNASAAAAAATRSVHLTVSESPPSSLRLTPNTRMIFRGERFTVECPPPQTNSTGGTLKRFSLDQTEGATVSERGQGSPHQSAAMAGRSHMSSFVAASGNSGLYWCESSEGRSSAVNITVSYGNMILQTPASPVFEGEEVILYCQSFREKHFKVTFFKDGEEITTSTSSSPNTVTQMNIVNVTRRDEGFYKCASNDRKVQSPESYLAVRPGRGNFTSTQGTQDSVSDSWKWILLSCGIVLLCVTPLTIWRICHHRKTIICTRSCCPLSKRDVPAVALPATKQDVTEVQWDLSWMEMSNLLDKHLYPGT